jgi:hypothetical protein
MINNSNLDFIVHHQFSMYVQKYEFDNSQNKHYHLQNNYHKEKYIFLFHFENLVINYLMACSSTLHVFILTNHVILAGYVPTTTYAFRTLQTEQIVKAPRGRG